jgi:hypothetical protein
MNHQTQFRPCDVCVILDNDQTIKECAYCGLCDKWICAVCRPNMLRRAEAVRTIAASPVLTLVNRIKVALKRRMTA